MQTLASCARGGALDPQHCRELVGIGTQLSEPHSNHPYTQVIRRTHSDRMKLMHHIQILPLLIASCVLGHLMNASCFLVDSAIRQVRLDPPPWVALVINEVPLILMIFQIFNQTDAQ